MIIDYSKESKKFVISCTFSENHMIQVMPNKRWQKRSKVWHVSNLSASCQYMLERLKKFMTPEALVVAEESVKKMKVKYEPFPSWYSHKTEPFDHQKRALNHSWGLPYDAFFMEMGTGKTKTAIDLFSAKIMNGDISSVLITCPLAVTDNWVKEIGIHSPIPDFNIVVVHDISDSKFKLIEKSFDRRPKIFIVGYESVRSGFKKGRAFTQLVSLLAHSGKYAMVIDECHFVKNPDSITSQNVEWFADHSTLRYIMTGTPIAQGIMDLYQQFKTMDINIIGMEDYYSYKNRYAEMGGYENKEIVGYKNVDELMGLIRPYVFQCTKEEAVDLPEKMYTVRKVKMTEDQEKVYRDLKKNCEAFIKSIIDKGRPPTSVEVDTALAKYSALQQITGGFIKHSVDNEESEKKERITTRLVEPSSNPKVKEIINIAKENPNKKIIIWARFREEIAQIVEGLETAYPGSVCQYHGGVDVEDRKEELRLFKESPEKLFFVSNQQTGGTGLTVNESHLTIYYSNSLQLVHRSQSEDRNHRIGQKNAVLYVDLVCEGTVDMDTLSCLRDKKDIAEFVRNSMTGHPTNGSSQPQPHVI